MINDLIALLMQVPPRLAAGWGAWFFVGLLLSMWGRREKMYLIVHKHKSGVRAAAAKPPSGVRAPVSKNLPASAADAFADLERLFEEPEAKSHRMPGERSSPVLAEVTGSNGAALAAPQSLP